MRGANIVRLKYNGEDVLVPLTNQRQTDENAYTAGSPLLLPANRTAGGKFSFRDKQYRLEINDKKSNANLHGFLHIKEFSVLKIERNRIVLQYENKGEIYPFPFIITADYTLENSGIEQKFTILNNGKTDMPYTFALHTTFCEPKFFRVPISLVEEKDINHIPTGRYLPLNTRESEYVSGCEPRGIAISGYYKANGNVARIGRYLYSVSSQFDHFILFNGGGNSGYLCVEPQAGAVNGLNLPGGCRVISTGCSDLLSVSIKV